MPNPTKVLQLVESALVMYGRAYLFRDRNRAVTKELRYHLPTSVTPKIDEATGTIEYFERPVNNVVRRFGVEDYVYFWPPDPMVEIGPSINYPAVAAAHACGVLLNIDVFADSFFSRGAIKAMLLTVKGMPTPTEIERLEAWWKKVVAGVKNAFGAKVVNAEAVTPVVVGEGMKELENVTIGKEKREDIALALGIPMSILFANAANYATSKQDDLNFLTKTAIPDCEFVASVLNEQVFDDLGLKLEFMPETLDAMQEDEAERSAALNALVNAGVPLIMAMNLLGFELTDEQIADLEEEMRLKEERAEAMTERLSNGPNDDRDEDEDEQDQPPNGEMAQEIAQCVQARQACQCGFYQHAYPG
jgi:phage portal protein BeeE